MEITLEPWEMAKALSNLKDNLGASQYSELWHYAEYLDIIIEYLSNIAKWKGKELSLLYEGSEMPDGIYVYRWNNTFEIGDHVQIFRAIKQWLGENKTIIAIPKESELELMSKEDLIDFKGKLNKQIDSIVESQES